MQPVDWSRISVTTGTPVGQRQTQSEQTQAAEIPFEQVLREQLAKNSNLHFSKHAVNRIAQRNVQLPQESLERLNEGVRIAEEKGLNETLILIDRTAFIVNIKNATVITTVDQEETQGNVFTNIDGTVII